MNGFRGGFGGGGFGGAGGLQNLMKQAQKMQEDMERIKEEIRSSEITAKSGGGLVEVIMSGDKKMKNIKLKKEVVDPEDIEMLQDLICAAVNDGLNQIEKMEKEKLPQLPMGI